MVYQRLESLESIGVKLGLENIRTLLDELGNPQNSFRSILIGGTNGKGSVGAMLAEILLQHGLRTGHYVSPHLTSVRERMRINNEWISSNILEVILSDVFGSVDRLLASGRLERHPTYFETLTAAAFVWFAQEKVDWAVVEVGMGGRFDATNALSQDLSVITTIDFDHESYLGHSLPEIAGEKAGIFKGKGPVVWGLLPPEARAVLLSAAEKEHVSWRETKRDDVVHLKLENGFPFFDYAPWKKQVCVGLRGRHQAENASTAMLTCEGLQEIGVAIERGKVLAGLANVCWRGRLELLSENPPILIDCAHNPAGVRSLAAFLEDMNWPRVVALFTSMKDKKYESMLQFLSPRIETLFLTRVPPLNRCATAEGLAQAAALVGVSHETVEHPIEAFGQAKRSAESKGLPLIVFGSIYLIGSLLKADPYSH